jgi:hypothetical protein
MGALFSQCVYTDTDLYFQFQFLCISTHEDFSIFPMKYYNGNRNDTFRVIYERLLCVCVCVWIFLIVHNTKLHNIQTTEEGGTEILDRYSVFHMEWSCKCKAQRVYDNPLRLNVNCEYV